jgi:mono/diheme cytochrome c family protein
MLAMAAVGSVLASPVHAQSEGDILAGRQLATVHCSRCHGIDDERFILVPGALPLGDLKRRYPEESLAAALAAGLRTAHLELATTFTREEIAGLLSYVNSLW